MHSCENESKTNNSAHGDHVSYHRFSKKLDLKEEWIIAIGRESGKPSKSSTLCSDHFDEHIIQISKKGSKYLIDKAIPYQKIIISQYQSKKKQKGADEHEAGPSNILPQNKVQTEEGAPGVKPGPSNKRPQKEERAPAAQPGPSKRPRPLNEKEQEEGPAAKKARKDKDPEPNQNPPIDFSKEKLYKMLQWNHDKIRKQHQKIKSLQTVNRNLTQNIRIIEKSVKLLDERINMTNENLSHLKMSLT